MERHIQRNLIEIEDAQIIWKNFKGLERKAMVNGVQRVVNDAGNRNFLVAIDPAKSKIWFKENARDPRSESILVEDPDFGKILYDMGYNISVRPGKEEGDPVQYRLPVAIKYPTEEDIRMGRGRFTPHLFMMTGKNNKVEFEESTVGELDEFDIVRADIVINNSSYINNQGEERAKAYCNEGYFYIARSRFASYFDEE